MKHLAFVLVSCLFVSSAHAQPKNCGDPPDVLFLLDHSLSMTNKVGAQSKWAHATAAINGVVSNLVGQVRPGLMLYPKFPGGASCEGGQVNVVPGDNTKNAIATTLSAAFPDGLTPTAVSLKNAFNFLQGVDPNKKKYVVLIADGYETCGGNPVDWVNAMMNAGIKTFIVGFGTGVNQDELNGLATAGGTALPGPIKFYQADDLAQLSGALAQIGSMVSCCGNGVLDPGEACDKSIGAGQPGACPGPGQCNDSDPCTADFVTGNACSVVCGHSPVLNPKHGDGCCPPGATSLDDNDCNKACGNGVLEAGETCDPQINSGPGKCKTPAQCNDQNHCTVDTLAGSACNVKCQHKPIKPILDKKDGCCPPGFSAVDDPDCPRACGPDTTDNCVDLCAGVNCPDGSYCKNGKCNPWPGGVNPGAGGDNPHGAGPPPNDDIEQVGCAVGQNRGLVGPALLPLALLLLGIRRRRR